MEVQWITCPVHQVQWMTCPVIKGSSATSSVPTKAPLPLQKRRRVTRACDECRRKKIKCDGKQPCTHCTVYSYECTYDQPSNRRRNPAPQYIEALENRLQRTEALLKAVLPDIDVNHPNFDLNKVLPQIQEAATVRTARLGINNSTNDNGIGTEKDSLLESMVEAAGRLDIDESGHMDFHGHSSGMAFLAHLNNQFGDLLGEDVKALKKMRSTAFPAFFDSPQSSISSSPEASAAITAMLPKKEVALVLVDTCLDDACILMRFVHRPTFNELMDQIYQTEPGNYTENQLSFLPLLYLTLAVGCIFVNDMSIYGVESPVAEGTKYFSAGRRMIEITDCRDIHSIQTVLMMVVFLQSSARMSTCYSFVGIALSASVRLGLHRSLPGTSFSPIEREIRKRIFWTVRKMDTYVGALLGLPKGIADEDIDQEMPAEVDDEYITEKEILPQPEGVMPAMAAANAHAKLLKIMGKLVKYIYPLKGVEASVTGRRFGYSVSYSKVHEIEKDLGDWLDALPMQLRPGGDTPQSLLKGCDERPYASAAACVNVSRKIVHTADEMRKKGILNGAYWFSMYTTFFSVITMLYYVLENSTDVTSLAILRDAEIGRDLLLGLKERSLAAKRCSIALQPLFDKVPQKIKPDLEKASLAKKKRARAGSKSGDADQSATWSNTSRTVSPDVSDSPQSRRSRTFPGSPDIDMRRQTTPMQIQRTAALTQTPEDLNRRSSYEVFTTAETFPSTHSTPDPQPVSFQAHLSGSGLPDLNALMFPSPDPFNYNYAHTMGQQQYTKTERMQQDSPSSPESMFGANGSQGNPYDSLEVQLFGPLPPYLLQGQPQSVSSDVPTTGGERPTQHIEVGDSRPVPNSGIPGQAFMSGTAGGAMNLDSFFGDEYEWDDVLMQQSTYRVQPDLKEQY
ncbi:hypothetical protein P167DRAFT_551998 [Morchella conica CCBAS932]|uniref:Zn(2)-C6 fungal-type domain-containing protein n=1 Tax=Morchella conica CCBAS932 TaxID=1392247 RepID=A0A3N4KXS4_9PEZI|nr:hypothetical protein P167DRAFT_551998 [Morchella conica CCBAS932]